MKSIAFLSGYICFAKIRKHELEKKMKRKFLAELQLCTKNNQL